jgi:F-type H+-transporting ATPase subunit gamma
MLASVASRVPPREDGSPAHPLLAARPEKNVVLVAVSGDKGLAGGFNTNVNRAVGAFVREAREKGIENLSLLILGKKASDFWRRRAVPILEARPGLFAKFDAATAAGIAKGLADRFIAGEIDAVYVVSNEFKSVISQVVVSRKLLPLSLEGHAAPEGSVDYLYEPAPDVILRKLLPRFLDFAFYRVLLESNAAFFAAQMTAMDSASKNAGEIIDGLTLTYNRARQARITKELIEIVSGAAALD